MTLEGAFILVLSFAIVFPILNILKGSDVCFWLRCYLWACNGCKRRRPCEYCYFYRLIRQKCARCTHRCADMYMKVFMR